MTSSAETALLLEIEHTHAVFTRAYALQHGVPRSLIDQRVRTGAYEVLQRSVYRLLGAPLTYESEVYAAVLAATDGPSRARGRVAAASHGTGARLLGFDEHAADPDADPIELTVTGTTRPELWGDVVIHRTAALPPEDMTIINGIPCTSGARLGVDLAQRLERIEVVRLADSLIGARHTKQAQLHACARRLAVGRRNVAFLAQLTEPGAAERFTSWLERTAEELFAGSGLPPRRWNRPLRGGQVDLGIPDVVFEGHLVIIELDGPRFHRTTAQITRDRRLDRARSLAGYLVLRYGYWEVVRRPQVVLAEIREALAVRSAHSPR